MATPSAAARAPVITASAASPAPASPQPLIDVERLSVAYAVNTALRDVTMMIGHGRLTALIGPSGCGKTSFLMCLNRLTDFVPGCRVSGRATVGTTEIFDPRTDVIALRRRVGMIFQKPNPFPLSIRRNLEFPLREHGVTGRDQLARIVETTLQAVGLWREVRDRLDDAALTLSGGQQQRLCLARALSLNPEILLMDEPCSALDPISSGVVEDLIVSLRGRYTVVVATHNLAQARRIADDAACFWVQEGAGRLIETGAARQLFDAPRQELTAAYVSGLRG
jgi:phosphate transport system ATP-binding protein